MPTDITGTDIIEEDITTGHRRWTFVPGPLFANVILADEVNRTPPKTQAALLQSMQEYRVSAGGNTFDLPLPFLVFATQNPIEQEGTYPLPEAQLDRFLFKALIGYPGRDEEVTMVKTHGHQTATPHLDQLAVHPQRARLARLIQVATAMGAAGPSLAGPQRVWRPGGRRCSPARRGWRACRSRSGPRSARASAAWKWSTAICAW